MAVGKGWNGATARGTVNSITVPTSTLVEVGDTVLVFILSQGGFPPFGSEDDVPVAWRTGGRLSYDDDNGWETRTIVNEFGGGAEELYISIFTRIADTAGLTNATWTFSSPKNAVCALSVALDGYQETRDLDASDRFLTDFSGVGVGTHVDSQHSYFMSDGPAPETNVVAAHFVTWQNKNLNNRGIFNIQWYDPLDEAGGFNTAQTNAGNGSTERACGFFVILEDLSETEAPFDPTTDPVPWPREASFPSGSVGAVASVFRLRWVIANVADGPVPATTDASAQFAFQSRRVQLGELPHQVTKRMLGEPL